MKQLSRVVVLFVISFIATRVHGPQLAWADPGNAPTVTPTSTTTPTVTPTPPGDTTKAKITCDASEGYLNMVSKTENLPGSPSQTSQNTTCMRGTTVSISDKGYMNHPTAFTYKASAALVPDKSARSISIAFKAIIKRGNFTEPMEHLANGLFDLEVPNMGQPYTPVRIHTTRRLAHAFTTMVNYSEQSNLYVQDSNWNQIDLSQSYQWQPGCLLRCDTDIFLNLAPGPYALIIFELSNYDGTGPQNSKGRQPNFSKTVKVVVYVPKCVGCTPTPD